MNRSEHELAYAYSLRHPQRHAPSLPFTGNINEWLIRLEVVTPFDADRLRDQERWRAATDRQHGEALLSLLSVVDAMQSSLQPKPRLAVRFPIPYRALKHSAPPV